MKKIEAIIKPYALEDVKAGLHEIGLVGMTVSEVRGYTGMKAGKKKAKPQEIVGTAFIDDASIGLRYGFEPQDDFVPSLKVELVLHEQMVDEAIQVIVETGQMKSFSAAELRVHSLVDVIRIRTEEHLEQAI
jgi:nitrogen regulatory protein P-II 1